LQEEEFYTGQNVAVLKPLLTMSKEQKLYYCMAITKNRFRYAAFGREANRTLKDLKVPALSEVPNFVKEVNFKKFDDINNVYLKNENLLLNTEKWQYFNFNELFTIKKGFYNKKPPVTNKTECVPFVGASEYNNGITSYIIKENIEKYSKVGKIDSSELISNKIFKSNCITVANNGASVASSFYQEKDFTCSHDVNILYLKEFTLNKYIALFLITLIKSEKYRWTYGRKWRIQRMEKSAIKLPITKKNTPDWSFMEEYIKSLPFSHSV
jgi:hypothetical protein